MAEALHVAVSTVRAWERGTSRPQPWQCPRLCSLLDLTAGELAAMLDDAAAEGGPVERRRFLADTTALTAGAALPAPPPGTSAELRTYFRDQLGEHHRADTLLGSGHVLPTVQRQFGTLEGLARAARGDERTELWRLAAAYAGRLTWLYQDGGDLAAADRWAARSIELAHRAGDLQLTAHALVNRAMIDTDRGDGPGTVELASGALAAGGKLCAKVRVQALQQAAHGHALNGDRDAADDALRQATPLVARIGDDFPWGVATLAPHYLTTQRATCYSRLGLGGDAAAVWADALSTEHPARDRAVFAARYARALADARRPEAAVEQLGAAVPLARAGSARLGAELATAWRALKPWHRSAPGRQARRMLTEARPS